MWVCCLVGQGEGVDGWSTRGGIACIWIEHALVMEHAQVVVVGNWRGERGGGLYVLLAAVVLVRVYLYLYLVIMVLSGQRV